MRRTKFTQFRVFATLAAGLSVGSNPAMATMTHYKPWINHAIPVEGVGYDLSDQHYAGMTITPKGNGVFGLDMLCENGTPGTTTSGTFRLSFLRGRQVLKEVLQPCVVPRGAMELEHQKKAYHQDLDLSDIIDQVDGVEASGY